MTITSSRRGLFIKRSVNYFLHTKVRINKNTTQQYTDVFIFGKKNINKNNVNGYFFKDARRASKSRLLIILKTIKWDFYLDQKFVKPSETLLHRLPSKSEFRGRGVIALSFLDLKFQSRLYELLVQIKAIGFSFCSLF